MNEVLLTLSTWTVYQKIDALPHLSIPKAVVPPPPSPHGMIHLNWAVWPQRTQAVLQAVSAVQSPSSEVQEVLAAASSPVLRIIIDNMFYPVTLDVLQQVGEEPAFYGPNTQSTCSAGNTFVFFDLTDIFKVWHSHEDYHLHQEQSVPGSSAVQWFCPCAAR